MTLSQKHKFFMRKVSSFRHIVTDDIEGELQFDVGSILYYLKRSFSDFLMVKIVNFLSSEHFFSCAVCHLSYSYRLDLMAMKNTLECTKLY